MNKLKFKFKLGFTLIELMVAITIFAIITVISYRTISSLIIAKERLANSQKKWGSVVNAISLISDNLNKVIPLSIRGNSEELLPALLGLEKLNNKNDSQLEFTISGYIKDQVIGSIPPKRIGFRFIHGDLYVVTWPVLNRVPFTTPSSELILSNISEFKVEYYGADKKWYLNWPLENTQSMSTLPRGVRLYMKLDTGEEIVRVWAIGV